MPKYGPFLPGIWESIYQILEQNRLVPDFYFTKENFYKTLDPQRFFIAPVKNSSGDKYIFKARIEDYQETKKTFKKEINFIQSVKQSANLNLRMPNFIKSGEKPIDWVLYDFIETCPLGNIAGVWENYKLIFPMQEISQLLLILQKNTKKNISNNNIGNIPRKKGADFIKEFDFYSQNLKKFLNKTELLKIRKELSNNKILLDKKSTVIAHGDFHPGNIIIQDNSASSNPFIIDWATLQINNYAYDITFLWATLILFPDIQYDLIQNFIKISPDKENFNQLFKLNLIRIIPQLIETFDYIRKKTGENFDKKINFLLKEFRIIRYSGSEINKAKKKILSKLKLSETKLLRKTELNNTPDFEVSLCKNKKTGDDFILKIMHRSYDDLKNRFINEVEITKFLTKNKKDICLQYMNSNIKSRPEWFAYKFVEGEKIGNFYRIFPKFLTESLTESVFSDILEIQKEYDKMPKKLKNKLGVKIEEKKDILNKDMERLVKEGFIFKEIAEKNKIIYNDNISKIPLFLNHNNLHPENLIINKGQVRIIDFNLASLNSQFFDFLTFVLCGWENKEWIEKSLQKLCQLYPELKKKDSPTRLSFDLSLIEASVKLIMQSKFSDKRDTKKLPEEIKNSNSAHQYFIKIFENLESFL